MDFLKTVTGKVISGMVGLAVIAGGISWWRMDEATKQMLLSGTGRILSWAMIVLLVPWATFFVISWVAKFNSNVAGGMLVFVYTVAEALLLAKLFYWRLPGATAWTFFATGALFAGVYNLLTCDWIAEKFEA
jgi:FtsH-binding integral membrane protein